MKKLSKLVSLMLSVVLCIGMAAPAFAVEYDISIGNVYVQNDDDGVYSYQGTKKDENISRDKIITITQTDNETATTGTITVGEGVTDTTITLKDVNIDVSETGGYDNGSIVNGEAALSIGKDSNVKVELEGENTLKSGYNRAGLELSGDASVTVQSDDKGSLNTTGGMCSAGIGSGSGGTAGAITISGSATVIATGGWGGAGIGSGSGGTATAGAITISTNGNGSVTAKGGFYSAGIGSGFNGAAGNITTSGSGTVTAKGGSFAAGIGSGSGGTAGAITISTNGSGSVTATGDSRSAGIGSGWLGTASNITICGTANVKATGQDGGEDIGRGVDGTVGHVTQNSLGNHDYKEVETTPASCTKDGVKTYTCSVCGHSYTEVIPANGHGEGVWTVTTPAQPGVEGVESLICPDCEVVLDTRPIPALPVPAIPDDGGADAAPDAATIADQEVPLAGLMPLYMLLEELRQHEEIPEIELPEDFKWIDHAYAQAIYWGLQEELVVDTEEEPLDPDEALTVGLMREVLVNFVERYLGLDNFVVTLAGEDDELVMDLGERLTAFYTELETALAKQEKAA